MVRVDRVEADSLDDEYEEDEEYVREYDDDVEVIGEDAFDVQPGTKPSRWRWTRANLLNRLGWCWNEIALATPSSISTNTEEFVIPRIPPQERHDFIPSGRR